MSTHREAVSAIERARAAWGDALPDWVRVLAEQCDASSQAKVAKRVGYSPATVSYVLKARYAGDMRAVEKAVRGAFMAATVDCPVLGALPSNTCLENQRRPFAATNHIRVQLYRACHGGCPHSKKAGGSDDL